MKSVLMSIKPKWCELIASGKKTIEVRKTKPKLNTPFKVYIYCTKDKPFLVEDYVFRGNFDNEIMLFLGNSNRLLNQDVIQVLNGKVIGEYVCKKVDKYLYNYCPHPEIGMDYDCGDNWWEIDEEDLEKACLNEAELRMYGLNSKSLYGWHISDLVIYDEPKELSDFFTFVKGREKMCDDYELKSDRINHAPCLDLILGSYKTLERPPQSWCYVEELK